MDKHMLAFGTGSRGCIGKKISLPEMHKLVPEVLRHFDLELVNNSAWKTMNVWFCSQELDQCALDAEKSKIAVMP